MNHPAGDHEKRSPARRALVIFPNIWLAYSPSTINIYDHLSPHFETTIVAFEPEHFSRQRLPGRNVDYVRIPRLLRKAAVYANWLMRRLGRRANIEFWIRAALLRARVRKYKAVDTVVAIDPMGLWASRRAFRTVHFLSLEIDRSDPFFSAVDPARIRSVIVQSEERYAHLFPQRDVRMFRVQNAPVFKSPPRAPNARQGLVFCGTAMREFGIFACLDFLRTSPSFTLNVHGAMPDDVRKAIKSDYADLLACGRLALDTQYLDLDEVPRYLSRFLIGFCLYDFRFPSMNTFNYRTVPSGKLFNYLAAGVPVVGIEAKGLQPVRDFDAGELICDLSPASIARAVDSILRRYDMMSRNCFEAARHFSFDRAIAPFIDFALHDDERR